MAEAAKAALVERVVLVSSAMVHPQNKWHPIRFILNNFITGFSGPVLFLIRVLLCVHTRGPQPNPSILITLPTVFFLSPLFFFS